MTLVSQDDLIAGAKAGKVVSFPTDTVPALAVRPDQSALIFEVKQRTQDKPLILMGASFNDLLPYVKGTVEEIKIWKDMAAKYLPGALTLVLPASEAIPVAMNPLDPTTIGVRVPNLQLARMILAQTAPLATTSANRSGESPLETTGAIAQEFPQVLTLKIEQEIRGSGLPSTVAKWTGEGWEVLRQGSVKL